METRLYLKLLAAFSAGEGVAFTMVYAVTGIGPRAMIWNFALVAVCVGILLFDWRKRARAA